MSHSDCIRLSCIVSDQRAHQVISDCEFVIVLHCNKCYAGELYVLKINCFSRLSVAPQIDLKPIFIVRPN